MSRRCPGYEKNSIREMSMTQIQMMMPDAAAKSLQLCPTLCDPIDGSPPGFPVPGILQAKTLLYFCPEHVSDLHSNALTLASWMT